MANLKQIRQRIRTSKSIQQITRAMKLVSAARLTRAKNRVEESRPYSIKMREFVRSLSRAGKLPSLPLLRERFPGEETGRYGYLLITAERGLAGSYNTNLIRKTVEFFRVRPGTPLMVAVGRKGANFFDKRGVEVVHYHSIPTSGPRFEDARVLTDLVRSMFVDQELDAVYLCYSRFHSPIRQEPSVVQLLPIQSPDTGGSLNEETEYAFEPEPKELLGMLLDKYLLTIVWQALLESTASEHGARMTAMSNATENAGKMIDSLTLTANRERQTKITTEILEVVSGAEALKS